MGDAAEVPHYVREADGANDDTRYVLLEGDRRDVAAQAATAGLRAGDQIHRVEGRGEVPGEGLDLDLLRGQAHAGLTCRGRSRGPSCVRGSQP